jgi:hypothetical protein
MYLRHARLRFPGRIDFVDMKFVVPAEAMVSTMTPAHTG